MKSAYKFNHIELFAGCGGLSLGLQKAGFELILANELSPMAAETFAYNFFNENFQELALKNKKTNQTFWLSSQYQDLIRRMRENPFEYPKTSHGITDIPKDISKLKGSLIVGNIIDLNNLLDNNSDILNALKSEFNGNGIDLISGGPPCQSFSMAGLREKNSNKNTLPWEFATFVSKIQPKIALLENVTGILRAFKSENGENYHAWFEVAKAFALRNYVPLCLHTNARFAGVAQNRPRFIMIAIRHDIFEQLYKKFNNKCTERVLFQDSKRFFELVATAPDQAIFGSLPYFDSMQADDFELFKNSFLHHLVDQKVVSAKEALDDLKINNPSKPSDFIYELNNTFSSILQDKKELFNHEHRNNGPLVQRRFRLYQILQSCNDKLVSTTISSILKSETDSLDDHIWKKLKKHEFLQINGSLQKFSNKNLFIEYLKLHPSKKQTQKALNPDSPAPAALSIPDDACHYDPKELRVLTVREMARIQSFPDKFIFRSKVTTGGQMRRFEVPQYTQVGNAVPPLFGLALGKSIAELLSKL